MLLPTCFLNFFRVFLKVCDELDKAKELNEYFRKTVLKHLKENVLKELQNKDDEMLVKLYVKQWKRFTIFTHYMRKLFSYLVSEI
jgi:DNA topoisomerase IB